MSRTLKAIAPSELTKRMALLPHLPQPEATAPPSLQIKASKEAEKLARRVRDANSTLLINEIVSDFEKLNPGFSLNKPVGQSPIQSRPPVPDNQNQFPSTRRPPLLNKKAPLVPSDFFPFEHLLSESSVKDDFERLGNLFQKLVFWFSDYPHVLFCLVLVHTQNPSQERLEPTNKPSVSNKRTAPENSETSKLEGQRLQKISNFPLKSSSYLFSIDLRCKP